jgi:hypothetical protein
MFMIPDPNKRSAALAALEATVASAREGFGCMFSTSDEYESALISQRRAEGRYSSSSRIPVVMFIGMTLIVFMIALLG